MAQLHVDTLITMAHESASDKTDKAIGKLTDTISLVVAALTANTEARRNEFEWFKSHAGLATKDDLKKLETKIMSAISDFAATVKTAFDQISDNVDAAVTSLAGLTADVQFLKDTIEKLQNNPGPISAEDQALLDAAQARAAQLASKAAALKDALATLDAQTEEPPTPTT